MSNQWDFDADEFDFDEDQTQQGNPLTQLRKALREKTKSEKAMAEQLATLQAQVRETALGNVVKSRGLPDKVARMVPRELTSDEEVTKWLDEYGDVFGLGKQPEQEQEKAPLTDNQKAQSQMDKVASTGTPLGGNAQEAAAKLQSSELTEAQLREMIQKGGVF